MRALFTLSLLALLAGVGIVAVIETDPGYVLVAYGQYTLETSLWVGLVLLALLLVAFYLLLRLVYRLVSGQRSLLSWWGSRRSDRAQRNSNRGVLSYVEGNFTRARSQLLRGVQGSETPLVNYLLAARASDRLEDHAAVDEYLGAALALDEKAAPAVAITRAEIHLRAGEYEQAVDALRDLRSHPSRHAGALPLLQQAYEGAGDWDALAGLLPDLRKHGGLPADELDALEKQVAARRLSGAADGPELQSVWKAVAPELKQDRSLVRLYVARQSSLGDVEGAEQSIVRALKKDWDPELVRAFGLLDSEGAAKRLGRAEGWLADHPEDAQLLLCLGRLCLREKLWGKARDYFESSYRVTPGPEVCAELGRLLLGLGEPKVAAAYYREGLLGRESGLPELPQPDKVVANHQLLERG